MDEKYKTFCLIAVVILLAIIFVFCRGSDTVTTDDNSYSSTIQQIEGNNDGARNEIGYARGKLADASDGLDRAIQRVDSLEDRAAADQRTVEQSRNIVADSRKLIEEERGIFAEIEKANRPQDESKGQTT